MIAHAGEEFVAVWNLTDPPTFSVCRQELHKVLGSETPRVWNITVLDGLSVEQTKDLRDQLTGALRMSGIEVAEK